MQQTRQRRVGQAWVTPGRLLGLLVALSGLVVMHGLSDHGAAGHLEGMGIHAASGHHPGMSEVGAGAMPDVVGALATVSVSVAGADGSGGPDGDELAMAGLCLAVLFAGLLMAGALRQATAHFVPRNAGAGLGGVAPRARAPDPPDLHRLSVHRC
jgi:hypothetical protein